MKLDHVCRVGKGARAPVVRVTCKLECARRAHAVGCQWWARRAKRAFAHPTIQFERDAPYMRLAVPIPIDLPLQITCYVADAQAASMMERALEAPGSAWGPEVLGMPNTAFAWCNL